MAGMAGMASLAELCVGTGGGGGARNLGSSRGRAIGGCSFLPGTQVLMADGTYKPIEELQAGDVVLATDPETSETGPREVLAPISDEGIKNLVHITVDTDGPAGDRTGTLIATDNHPFWAADHREWVTAGELRAGSLLQTAAGTSVQVGAVRKWTAYQRVHNLTVDDIHTYYVLAGNVPVLVHNTPCQHTLEFTHVDASGKTRSTGTFWSGNMTAEEKALGFPRSTLATHTEVRALNNLHLRSRDTLYFEGRLPPL